ncbi:alpha/beta fold hydrolase [Acinetobacter sp. HY1485]|uniref:alpha/beta fold hydrolase n=1 Tax=Acinetobacter sp. HY1485 TaxID=2970918 RepID=UPI0022B986D8|nr:alpha/beta hydrolase [Acinetobacter sp. HY1485]
MEYLFFPGASGNTQFWHPLIQNLNLNAPHRIIAYPSFHGCADHPDVQNFQDLTNYVLDQVTQECGIIAQSMGGIFAVLAALKKPHLVKKLVLVATSGGIDLTPFDVADWRADYHHQNYVPDWFSTAQIHLDITQIQCPTLLLWGSADTISPISVGQYLQRTIPNAQLHVIDNGDHQFACSQASVVAPFVQSFL